MVLLYLEAEVLVMVIHYLVAEVLDCCTPLPKG